MATRKKARQKRSSAIAERRLAKFEERLEGLSGSDFESVCKELLLGLGYSVDLVRENADDLGIDMIATSPIGESLRVVTTVSVKTARKFASAQREARSGQKKQDSRLLVMLRDNASDAAKRSLTENLRGSALTWVWDGRVLASLMERESLGGSERAAKSKAPASCHLARLVLENVRGIKRLEIDFEAREGILDQALFIGKNGTGKSTILRCIALVLSPEHESEALLSALPGRLVREGESVGRIQAELVDGGGVPHWAKLHVERDGHREHIVRHDSTSRRRGFFCCGYGAGRGVAGSSNAPKFRVMDAVLGLFDYATPMMASELLIRRLRDFMGQDWYADALRDLKRVLGLTARHSIKIKRGGGVIVSGPGIGKDVPLEAMADGYRVTLGWMMDLFGRAIEAEVLQKQEPLRGILLIDEIEQHLHPELQFALLDRIRKLLSGMQLISTSHSPLVALGAEDSGLFSLHRQARGVSLRRTASVHGLSADDILELDVGFDTHAATDGTRQKLKEHQTLALKKNRSKKETVEMKRLAKELPLSVKDSKDAISLRLDEIMRRLNDKE